MKDINYFKDIAIKCDFCKKEHEGPIGLAYIQIGSSIKMIKCVCPECEKKVSDEVDKLIKSLTNDQNETNVLV